MDFLKRSKECCPIFLNRVIRCLIAQLSYSDPVNIDDESNILFIEASNSVDGWGLGNGIFRIPAIEALSHTTGNTTDILTTERRATIFQDNPHIGNILTVQEYWMDTINHIRENGYSHIFMLNPSWRMFLMTILAGDSDMVKRIYFIPRETLAGENHIDMYIQGLQRPVRNLIVPHNTPRIYWETNDTLPEGNFYIEINVGAKSALRNFKDWGGVFNQVKKPIPKNVKFVLVGNSQVGEMNIMILEKLGDSVIDCTTNLSLNETYNIISQCRTFIGADGGNVNAALAILQENVFPIYSVVAGQKRLPSNFPEDASIQGKCSMYETGCFEYNLGTKCNVTGQFGVDYETVPPCISNPAITGKIVSQIEWLFHHAENWLKLREAA